MTSNANNVINNLSESQFTKEGVLEGLVTTSVPMKMVGVEYVETTDSLSAKIVDMIDTSYGISEIDHCFMYPLKNREGQVVDFEVKLYFNTEKPCKEKNLTRIGGSSDRAQGGGVNLMQYVTSRGASGAFSPSNNFKKVMSAIAKLKDGNNIIIEEEPHNKNIAIVRADFFKLVGMLLNVRHNDPFNFVVADCQPTTNRDDCINFRLVIVKEIMPEDRRRNNRSGINYDALDRKSFQSSNKYR